MWKQIIVAFFVSASLFAQCTGVKGVNAPPVQSEDLQDILQETRRLISSAYQQGYERFQNVSQAASSVIPEIRDRGARAIKEINEKYLQQYEKIVNLGIEADIDVDLCLDYFELDEDTLDSDLSIVDECFTDRIETFMNAVYRFHRSYNEDFLVALYKIDLKIMECSDSKCLDDIVPSLDDTRIVLPGLGYAKLSRNEVQLGEYFKDIETCTDSISALSEAAKAAIVKGFQDCIGNEIRANKPKNDVRSTI